MLPFRFSFSFLHRFHFLFLEAKTGLTFIKLYNMGNLEFRTMRAKDTKLIEETMKLIEEHKIAADVVWHEPSEAKEVASNLGMKADGVLKTLTFIKSDGSPVLVMVPSDRKACEKKLSAVVGGAVRLAKAREVRTITGREVGDLSPFGLGIDAIVVDETLGAKSALLVQAGPCATIKMSPADFFRVIGEARVTDVCQSKR